MVTTTSTETFVRNIAAYGKKVEDREAAATTAAARAASAAIAASGSRYSIKGRGGNKVKLGAKAFPTMKVGGSAKALVEAVPAGFWNLVEKGSYHKPGGWDIYPRKVGKRAARNAARRGQVLFQRTGVVTPNGIFAHVHHPHIGSIGHPWITGVVAANRAGRVAFDAEIISVFGASLKAA